MRKTDKEPSFSPNTDAVCCWSASVLTGRLTRWAENPHLRHFVVQCRSRKISILSSSSLALFEPRASPVAVPSGVQKCGRPIKSQLKGRIVCTRCGLTSEYEPNRWRVWLRWRAKLIAHRGRRPSSGPLITKSLNGETESHRVLRANRRLDLFTAQSRQSDHQIRGKTSFCTRAWPRFYNFARRSIKQRRYRLSVRVAPKAAAAGLNPTICGGFGLTIYHSYPDVTGCLNHWKMRQRKFCPVF